MANIDLKKFYGLADIRTIIQEKIDRTLGYCTPAWLDDLIIVTRGSKEDHERKLFDVLSKLEKAGYRISKKQSEFFMNQTKWLGHEIDENGIKLNEEKVEAILKLNPPENTKELKSFFGAIQYMAKFLPKLSERTDRLRFRKTRTFQVVCTPLRAQKAQGLKYAPVVSNKFEESNNQRGTL